MKELRLHRLHLANRSRLLDLLCFADLLTISSLDYISSSVCLVCYITDLPSKHIYALIFKKKAKVTTAKLNNILPLVTDDILLLTRRLLYQLTKANEFLLSCVVVAVAFTLDAVRDYEAVSKMSFSLRLAAVE